jgi:hypothetical protein
MPNKVEIRGLEQRGNESPDWASVRLLGAGSLGGIRNCRFEGHSILRLGDQSTVGPILRNSLIRDCLLGVCTVDSVALLERVIIDHGAVLHHVGVCSGKPGSRFCLGLAVHPGAETGARRVFLADNLLLSDCAAMAALPPDEQEALAHEWTARLKPCVSDYAFIGVGARVEHVRFLEDSFVGAGATIRGAAAVRRCVLAANLSMTGPSATADSVIIGDNVIAEDCVLEAGVHLNSSAQVRRSLFLERSGAEHSGHVADSVIGPNTTIAKGEVTASLVGPFVGFHHQALLIGTLWPQGCGNVGYGANVGSNHTGRKPDQELRPGEGTFFGLGCAIKFPADFSAAPYSLFATGVVTPPQKIAFPFSLITPSTMPSTNFPLGEGPGVRATSAIANEIIPGWMWSENAYALIRNAYKYADRNKAQNHPLPDHSPITGSPVAGTFLAADLFSSRVADHVGAALATLEALPSGSTGILTDKDMPAVGQNFMQARRVAAARGAYRHYMAFVFFRALLWDPEAPLEPSSKILKWAERAGLKVTDHSAALEVLESLGVAVEASLRKDAARGEQVFADYGDFHPEAATDPVCVRLRAELAALRPILRARLAQWG